MNHIFSLKGLQAVVTGCAGGIGQGIAVGLARAGADIVALDIENLDETIRQVTKLGRQCRGYRVDLSSVEEIDDVWKRILEEAGNVDILVNNAGIQHRESAFTYPVSVFDRVLAVNLRAAYALAQKAACHFKERGWSGKIINTGSLFSSFGGSEVSGYTCSKHGLLGLTRALSNEFASYGICVNAIAPGYIQTEMTKAVWSNGERRRAIDERIPAGHWGSPEDFEGPLVFLASRASDYVTGILLPVDGGYSAR